MKSDPDLQQGQSFQLQKHAQLNKPKIQKWTSSCTTMRIPSTKISVLIKKRKTGTLTGSSAWNEEKEKSLPSTNFNLSQCRAQFVTKIRGRFWTGNYRSKICTGQYLFNLIVRQQCSVTGAVKEIKFNLLFRTLIFEFLSQN